MGTETGSVSLIESPLTAKVGKFVCLLSFLAAAVLLYATVKVHWFLFLAFTFPEIAVCLAVGVYEFKESRAYSKAALFLSPMIATGVIMTLMLAFSAPTSRDIVDPFMLQRDLLVATGLGFSVLGSLWLIAMPFFIREKRWRAILVSAAMLLTHLMLSLVGGMALSGSWL